MRVEAARVLARLRNTLLDDEEVAGLDLALAEYFASLDATSDVPGSHLARGATYEQLGEFKKAEVCYRLALRLDPSATGPRSNLAALMDREIDEARQAAEEALAARRSRSSREAA